MELTKYHYNIDFLSLINLPDDEYDIDEIKTKLLKKFRKKGSYIFLPYTFIKKMAEIKPRYRLSSRIRLGLFLSFISKELILVNDKPNCYYYHYDDMPINNSNIKKLDLDLI